MAAINANTIVGGDQDTDGQLLVVFDTGGNILLGDTDIDGLRGSYLLSDAANGQSS